MPFKETLVETREQRGMTQQELASKLYVTRQAVSRWENGETEPSVDMRKLIATVLDIPADGAENPDYCQWCYDSGHFVYQSEDELIEKTTPFLMEATGMSQDEAVSFMGVIVPHLKHWQR